MTTGKQSTEHIDLRNSQALKKINLITKGSATSHEIGSLLNAQFYSGESYAYPSHNVFSRSLFKIGLILEREVAVQKKSLTFYYCSHNCSLGLAGCHG